MKFLSPKQRGLVMALLRKKGLFGKLNPQQGKLFPKPHFTSEASVLAGVVSGRHVKGLKELLDSGVDGEKALDMVRSGGVWPKLPYDLKNGFYKTYNRMAQRLNPRLIPGVTVGMKSPIDDPKISDLHGYEKAQGAPLVHPLLRDARARYNGAALREVDDLFHSWWAASTLRGAYKLRSLVRQTFEGFPESTMIRPGIKRGMFMRQGTGGNERAWAKQILPVVKPRARQSIDLAHIGKYYPERFPFLGTHKKYLIDLYATNQAILAKKYPDSEFITLYRGISKGQAEALKDSLSKNGMAVLHADILSSWSENSLSAMNFATIDGLVIRQRVHRSRSLTSHLAVGKGEEKEHIIMGDRFWIAPEDVRDFGAEVLEQASLPKKAKFPKKLAMKAGKPQLHLEAEYKIIHP